MARMDVQKGTMTITAVGDLDAANGIDIRGADCLWFTIDADETTTSLTWYVSHDGVNYGAAKNESNEAITQTVAHSVPYPMPAALNGVPFVLAIGDAAASAVYSTKRMHG